MLVNEEYSLYYDEEQNYFYQKVGDDLWKNVVPLEPKKRKDNDTWYLDVFAYERNKFDTKYVQNRKKRKRFGVANTICELYHGKRSKKTSVGYKDGNKNNCSKDNVFWVE